MRDTYQGPRVFGDATLRSHPVDGRDNIRENVRSTCVASTSLISMKISIVNRGIFVDRTITTG